MASSLPCEISFNFLENHSNGTENEAIENVEIYTDAHEKQSWIRHVRILEDSLLIISVSVVANGIRLRHAFWHTQFLVMHE